MHAMRPMIAKHWQSWFDTPVPSIGNITPRQASQSAEGRALLDQLLNSYDQLRQPLLDLNVPTDWAKWKLGYGPGSSEQFAEEEAIYYNSPDDDDIQPTRRTTEQQARLDKKVRQFFIPRRCEFSDCDKAGRDTTLHICGRCRTAYYCSREHQTEDWTRHKVECSYIKNSGLTAHTYVTSEELEKYPIGCFPIETPPEGTPLQCFVCGATPSEVNLDFTECCNVPVCDNEHEYALMSYSRDHCGRSHRKYTACGSHFAENHSGDWRQCAECNALGPFGTRPFTLTNRFNVTPALESVLPRGSFVSQACGNNGCRNRFIPGHDSSVFSKGKEVCSRGCSLP